MRHRSLQSGTLFQPRRSFGESCHPLSEVVTKKGGHLSLCGERNTPSNLETTQIPITAV
jgi:hypothetical protein